MTSSYAFDYAKSEKLSTSRTIISEALKKNGIYSSGFHSNPYLCGFFGWNRGWNHFYDSMQDDVTDISPYIKGDVINQKVDKWLQGYKESNGDEPFFLWAHYMDVHCPLIVSGQGQGKSDKLTSGLDIPPTVMSLFGLAPEPNFQGQAMLPLDSCADKGAFGEAVGKLKHKIKPTDKPAYYCKENDHKITYRLEDDKWELYDLANDPSEENNLQVPICFTIDEFDVFDEIVIRPHNLWVVNILGLKEVDEKKCIARTKIKGSYPLGMMIQGDEEEQKRSLWLENALEVLDKPGEWVLNMKERKLYLWPEGDEPGNDLTVPTLMELVRVEGDIDYAGPEDKPVRNIVFRGLAFTQGDRDTWTKDEDCYVDYNLLYSAGNPEFAQDCLKQWQEEEQVDLNGLAADPRFVDPGKGDFTLKPGSPALKLGIEQIDFRKIGLRSR